MGSSASDSSSSWVGCIWCIGCSGVSKKFGLMVSCLEEATDAEGDGGGNGGMEAYFVFASSSSFGRYACWAFNTSSNSPFFLPLSNSTLNTKDRSDMILSLVKARFLTSPLR